MNNNFIPSADSGAASLPPELNASSAQEMVATLACGEGRQPAGLHSTGQQAVPCQSRVLVVGTTGDYIEWLRQANPGRSLFVTDPFNRDQAIEPPPEAGEEVICDLDDAAEVSEKLQAHLRHWGFTVDGVACFDCESLELAALLAQEFSLPYPSVASIRLCRDKHLTKNSWQKNGVRCPQVRLVQSAEAVFGFLQEIDAPCVLKPLSGSGSELVFYCASRRDCEKGAALMLAGLAAREGRRLYSNATSWFLAEEFVAGLEFSCDCTITGDRVDILRLTQKIKDSRKPFGTIDGYTLSDGDEAGLDRALLAAVLQRGAAALGITDAICMVDFLVCRGEVILLEMTPRPGGDCLPALLRQTAQFDILSYALDFAQGRQKKVSHTTAGGLVALRLHAEKSGEIQRIASTRLWQDPRIREVNILRKSGNRVTMPPADYESWYLGHLLFQPYADIALEQQCRELRKLLEVEIEDAGN